MDRFFERGILALVLAILIFAPLAMGAVETWAFLVVQMLIMGVMLLWGLRLALIPGAKLFWPALGWPVLAFALYAVARYLTADIEYAARFEMIQTLLYAFLFFAIVNNLTSRECPQVVFFVLVILAAGISCFAIWQFMTHSSRVWNEISPYQGRATGTYISPNNFSCFLEMTMPATLAFLLAGRVKALTRIWLCYALLIMGFALAVTFSRGGWVAAGVGIIAVLAILLCHRKHRLTAFIVIVVLSASLVVFVTKYFSRTFGYINRVESIESGDKFDLEFRADMWRAAERMWADHFWFGVGPAHYDFRFRQYRSENVQGRPDRAHNDYLNLVADWGTTGGIIVAGGILIFGIGLVRTWKAVRPDERELGRGMSNRFAFFVGASAALLALAAHSVVDFNLHIPANALIGVAFLALLANQSRFAAVNREADAGVIVRIGLIIALAGGVAYFGIQGYRREQESIWQARAGDLNLPFLERAALLEHAFTAEPENFQTAYDIAELYRLQSFQGGDDYEVQARTAMEWYLRGMKLNRFDGYDDLGYGMCLDWLDRHDESEAYYSRAEALDPNGYFTVAYVGWHYIQAGDYAAARVWLERSLRLEWNDNPIASSYWDIVQDRLAKQASGQPVLPAGYQ
ncbi:MAG TPA: O-antigen ligase family protein [Verrucomicrobiae bacterium]